MKKHRRLLKVCITILSVVLLVNLVFISRWVFMLSNKDLALERALKIELPSGCDIVKFSGISIDNFNAKIKISEHGYARFVGEMNAQYHDGSVNEENADLLFPEGYKLKWVDEDVSKVKFCWELYIDGIFPRCSRMILTEDTTESGETAYYFYISR